MPDTFDHTATLRIGDESIEVVVARYAFPHVPVPPGGFDAVRDLIADDIAGKLPPTAVPSRTADGTLAFHIRSGGVPIQPFGTRAAIACGVLAGLRDLSAEERAQAGESIQAFLQSFAAQAEAEAMRIRRTEGLHVVRLP